MTPTLAGIDLSARTLRRNIWAGLLCASDTEIREGMDFYPGAHGLCRLFARAYGTTPERVAGIYAALSPLNGWETNVANIVDVLRFRAKWRETDDWLEALIGGNRVIPADSHHTPKVNTSHSNRDKALRIAFGSDPLTVLRGRKVRAFYSAMANPDDPTLPHPIDRHLVCLALGAKLSKNALSRAIGSSAIYTAVERAYLDLGRREGLGNRLASIAWFVQRRIARDQHPMPHPGSPVCCGRPMQLFGKRSCAALSARLPRYRCPMCTRLSTPGFIASRGRSGLSMAPPEKVLVDPDALPLPGPVTVSRRGYPRIHLGTPHPYANSAGWQYLARYITMTATNELLRRDEEVHHDDGNKLNCRRDNLRIMLKESHGRHHARYQLLYMLRDQVSGRFLPSDVPAYDEQMSELGDSYAYGFHYDSLSEVPF